MFPLRPLTVGDVLDGAVAVVRRHPRPTLGVSAVAALVLTISTFSLQLLLRRFQQQVNLQPDSVSGSDLGTLAAGTGGVAVLGYLVGLLVTGFVAPVVARAALGQEASLGSVWRQVRPRLGALLVASLLTTLLVLVCAITLVGIPVAVYLYTALHLATVVVVLEGGTGRRALGRSRRLVAGSWWRVFGITLLATLLTGVVNGILTLPFQLAGGGVSGLTGSVVRSTPELLLISVGSLIVSTLTLPFTAAVVAMLYLDLRMRKEGLDVALATAAGVAPRPPAPAWPGYGPAPTQAPGAPMVPPTYATGVPGWSQPQAAPPAPPAPLAVPQAWRGESSGAG